MDVEISVKISSTLNPEADKTEFIDRNSLHPNNQKAFVIGKIS